MSSIVPVAIHPSEFPQNVRRDLVASLQTRQINHKFHYESLKQSQKWLALHQAYSPSRTQVDCAEMYDRSFAGLVRRLGPGPVEVVGLGCGGGQKDARLLRRLIESGHAMAYTPVDVSLPLVLTAREAALAASPEIRCRPLVCDLATAEDLAVVLDELAVAPARPSPRILTFFGMLPNFEPDLILPRLASLVRIGDWLLLGANLAPGNDYSAGVRHILPQYDNPLTRDWLMTFLTDIGFEAEDGDLRFTTEAQAIAGQELRRIAAYSHLRRARIIQIDQQEFAFSAGDAIRLFFSYRHTPELVRAILRVHKLLVVEEWVAESGEEGVFLARRA